MSDDLHEGDDLHGGTGETDDRGSWIPKPPPGVTSNFSGSQKIRDRARTAPIPITDPGASSLAPNLSPATSRRSG